jgi:hypothetical protein
MVHADREPEVAVSRRSSGAGSLRHNRGVRQDGTAICGNCQTAMTQTLALDLGVLRAGDLIFSSTDGTISRAIRIATVSKFSHASIYYRDGVIFESNDDGVRPRRIALETETPSGSLGGLPYDSWSTLVVLRLNTVTSARWEAAIDAALDTLVGLDYPPLHVMTQGGPPLARFFFTPLAALLDAVEWVRNREPMAAGPWCSRLLGDVLTSQLAHRLTTGQIAALNRASPQRLFEVAHQLGFEEVANAAFAAQAKRCS